MKKFLKNLLLYFSAFVPMYVLVLVKLLVEIANSNLSFNILNTTNLITLLLLIVCGVFGLLWNVRFSREKSIHVHIFYVKNITEDNFLGYSFINFSNSSFSFCFLCITNGPFSSECILRLCFGFGHDRCGIHNKLALLHQSTSKPAWI